VWGVDVVGDVEMCRVWDARGDVMWVCSVENILAPFKIAAIVPVIIKNLSNLLENLNIVKKDTIGSFSFLSLLFFPASSFLSLLCSASSFPPNNHGKAMILYKELREGEKKK
jgi:hypothetical protein